MAITSANPDNDSTTKTALSFGSAAVGTDENADGAQSLRVEFPTETNTGPATQPRTGASLSEYYLGDGVVPTKPQPVGETYTYGEDQLRESAPNFNQQVLDETDVVNNAPSSLSYVRRVTALGAISTFGVAAGWQEGDLLFAYNYSTQGDDDFYGYTFKISNGTIGEEYEYNGYMYTNGASAALVPVVFVQAEFIDGIIGDEGGQGPDEEDAWVVKPLQMAGFFNTLFDRYYIKRRVIAAGDDNSANTLTPVNATVPLANRGTNGLPTNAISFSNLYGSKRYFSGSETIPGHDSTTYGTVGTRFNYIYNSYPTTITLDGTNVRSGNHPATTTSTANVWRQALVPMRTIQIDPSEYTSGVKFIFPIITYYSSGDGDPGSRRVDIKNVGVKINHIDSAGTQTGIALANDVFTLTGFDGQSLSSSHNPRIINSDDNFTATTPKNGTFIVYLIFDHYQTNSSYGDPDLNIRMNQFVIKWETP